ECLSLCVSPAQREVGLPGRDCRTTKMRERDARAAIAANAAQIRLCVKTVIARSARSPGTGGRICKARKVKNTRHVRYSVRGGENSIQTTNLPRRTHLKTRSNSAI